MAVWLNDKGHWLVVYHRNRRPSFKTIRPVGEANLNPSVLAVCFGVLTVARDVGISSATSINGIHEKPSTNFLYFQGNIFIDFAPSSNY